MSASGAHYEAERAEHLRNADEELALGDGFVANELLHPVLNKESGKEVENVEDVRITVGGVEFIPDGLSSREALADKPPDLRDYKILSVDTEYVKPPLAQVADKLLPPVLNKVDSDLVDAVFNARIEALAALRRWQPPRR